MKNAKNERWQEQSVDNYTQFCTEHNLYSATSESLVNFSKELLEQKWGVVHPEIITDLACGTGETSHFIMKSFPHTTIFAVDSSEDMLQVARERLELSSVNFVEGSGNKLASILTEQNDLIVCNSAIWLMNLPKVLSNAVKLMKKNSLLCFNFPGYLIKDSECIESSAEQPLLMRLFTDAMHEIPCTDINTAFKTQRYQLTEARLISLAETLGLRLVKSSVFKHAETIDCTYDSLSIPAIFDSYSCGVDEKRAKKILMQLYEVHRDTLPSIVCWINYAFCLK
jgi:ubiquinone/menaquinone biosynthesis C-methylase UbiE